MGPRCNVYGCRRATRARRPTQSRVASVITQLAVQALPDRHAHQSSPLACGTRSAVAAGAAHAPETRGPRRRSARCPNRSAAARRMSGRRRRCWTCRKAPCQSACAPQRCSAACALCRSMHNPPRLSAATVRLGGSPAASGAAHRAAVAPRHRARPHASRRASRIRPPRRWTHLFRIACETSCDAARRTAGRQRRRLRRSPRVAEPLRSLR